MFVTTTMCDEQSGVSGVKRKLYDIQNSAKNESSVENSDSELVLTDISSDDENEHEDEEEDFKWTDKGTRQYLNFVGNLGLLSKPSGSNPIDYFNLLVDKNFYESTIQQANMYMNHKELDVDELKKFIGLTLHMGVIQITRPNNYWKTSKLFNLPCFSQYMGRNRYFIILKCLQQAQKPLPNDPISRFGKTQAMIDYFNTKMSDVYYPEKQLLLDVSMLPLRRNARYREHLQDKAIINLSLHVLAEHSGLVLKLKCCTKTEKENPKITALDLLQEYLHKGHSVYMESFYSSVSLAKHLLSCRTYSTGILKTTRKGNCPEVTECKLNKGEIIVKYSDEVVMGKWRHHKEVAFVSTEHSGEMIKIVNRKGDSRYKPKALILHSEYMSAVDKKDQMLSYNLYESKSISWYMKIWLHIIHLMVLNSYFLYNMYSGKQKMHYYDFRLSIIENLLEEKKEEDVVEIRQDFDHFPAKVGRAMATDGHIKRRRCKVCYRDGVRKNTTYFCPKCPEKPGLCLEPCFVIYHQQKE